MLSYDYAIIMPRELGTMFPKLNLTAKLLLSHLYAIDEDNNGCYASNEYFGVQMGISARAVSRLFSTLKETGALTLNFHSLDEGFVTRLRTIKMTDVVFNLFSQAAESIASSAINEALANGRVMSVKSNRSNVKINSNKVKFNRNSQQDSLKVNSNIDDVSNDGVVNFETTQYLENLKKKMPAGSLKPIFSGSKVPLQDNEIRKIINDQTTKAELKGNTYITFNDFKRWVSFLTVSSKAKNANEELRKIQDFIFVNTELYGVFEIKYALKVAINFKKHSPSYVYGILKNRYRDRYATKVQEQKQEDIKQETEIKASVAKTADDLNAFSHNTRQMDSDCVIVSTESNSKDSIKTKNMNIIFTPPSKEFLEAKAYYDAELRKNPPQNTLIINMKTDDQVNSMKTVMKTDDQVNSMRTVMKTDDQVNSKSTEKISVYQKIVDLTGITVSKITEIHKLLIDGWFKQFSFEVIKEACKVMILNAPNPTFRYIDKILSDWARHGVKTIQDAQLAVLNYRKKARLAKLPISELTDEQANERLAEKRLSFLDGEDGIEFFKRLEIEAGLVEEGII